MLAYEFIAVVKSLVSKQSGGPEKLRAFETFFMHVSQRKGLIGR